MSVLSLLVLVAVNLEFDSVFAGPMVRMGAHSQPRTACGACHREPVWMGPLSLPPRGVWRHAWSPDGAWLAFTSGPAHLPPRLYLLEAASGRVRSAGLVTSSMKFVDEHTLHYVDSSWGIDRRQAFDLTSDERRPVAIPLSGAVKSVAISPDGSRIAYCLRQGRFRDLCIADANGENARGVTSNFWVRSCAWRPDGRAVLFQIGALMSTGVWEYDIEADRVSPVFSGVSYYATPSPDGAAIAAVIPRGSGRHDLVIQAWSPAASSGTPKESDSVRLGLSDVKREAISWTSDSQRVAFVRKTDGGSVWSVSRDGKDLRRHSPPGIVAGQPSWDPAGNWLAFAGIGVEGASPELFLVSVDGRRQRRFAPSAPSYWRPEYSSDGRYLAFFSTRRRQVDAYILNRLNGRVHRCQLPDGALSLPTAQLAFSPDGQRLAVGSGDRVFLLDSKAGRLLRDFAKTTAVNSIGWQDSAIVASILRRGSRVIVKMDAQSSGSSSNAPAKLLLPRPPEIPRERWDSLPAVSPDGDKLAFVRGTDVWIADSGEKARPWAPLAANQRVDEKAACIVWSPDSGSVLMRLVRRSAQRVESRWVAVVHTSSRRRLLFAEEARSELTIDLETYAGQPCWFPDGRRILFVSRLDGRPNLYSLNLKSGALRRLTREGALFPAISPDGEEIAYVSLQGGRETLYRMDADGSSQRRLFDRYRSRQTTVEENQAPPVADPDPEAAPKLDTGASGNHVRKASS